MSSSAARDALGRRLLLGWADFVQRRAAWVLCVSVLLAAGGAYHAQRTLRMDTDRDAMIDPGLAFQRDKARLHAEFEHFDDLLVLVLDGAVAEDVRVAALQLAECLRAEPELFRAVRVPRAHPFLERNGLLFLEPAQLERLALRLTQVQPVLARLTRDPSLLGFASLLAQVEAQRAERAPGATPIDVSAVQLAAAEALEQHLLGRAGRLSWQTLLSPEELQERGSAGVQSTRQYVLAQVDRDFTRLLPAGPAIERLRELRGELGFDDAGGAGGAGGAGVRLSMTGEIVLGHEELESVQRGSVQVGAMVCIAVLALLTLGLRSWRLVLASSVALAVGLALTALFAALAIGHLNLISIAFGALYLGIGVDFAIHLTLRYREAWQDCGDARQAWRATFADVAVAMLLCAVTTSIGFFAFVPTAYTGVGELGIIAGVGMGIGFVATLSVVPAILTLLPLPRSTGAQLSLRLPRLPASSVRWSGLVLAVGALALAPRLRFDPNPLNLRDPDSESVATFRELLETSATPPWSLHVLVDERQQARALVRRLAALPSVGLVVDRESFVPAQLEQKWPLLDELAWVLGTDLSLREAPAHALPETRAALQDLARQLNAEPTAGSDADAARRRLGAAVQALAERLEELDPASAQQLVAGVEEAWLGTLPANLERLRSGLEAQDVQLSSLPADLTGAWLSPSGLERIEVFPAGDLDEPQQLERFVSEVCALAPRASGPPVSMLRTGDAIVSAFRRALLLATLAIGLILWLVLRRLLDVLLVLAPLVLAGLLTVALLVLTGSALNFANVIALPLLLGLGVDSGVHLVHRARHSGELRDPLSTSTGRAVVFSSLTTLCSFASLALSPHVGTASLGRLLALGLSCSLGSMLFLLPALLPAPSPSGERG